MYLFVSGRAHPPSENRLGRLPRTQAGLWGQLQWQHHFACCQTHCGASPQRWSRGGGHIRARGASSCSLQPCCLPLTDGGPYQHLTHHTLSQCSLPEITTCKSTPLISGPPPQPDPPHCISEGPAQGLRIQSDQDVVPRSSGPGAVPLPLACSPTPSFSNSLPLSLAP